MKAAVVHQLGSVPVVEEFAVPQAAEGQTVMRVLAASLKNIDKLRVSGAHYTSMASLPMVAGLDGVVEDDNGKRYYAMGQSGMLAEQALVAAQQCIALPDGIDDASAAALPNAVIGSASALRYRIELPANATVLVNGATGVTGKIAVQVARLYGASRIIATGRNAEQLEVLRSLGADEVVSLLQDEADVVKRLHEIHCETPFDVVLDYTWGRPVELILQALQAKPPIDAARSVKLITIGQMASPHAQLSSGTFRSTAIEILGSGFGSLSAAQVRATYQELLPELFARVADGSLRIDTQVEALERLPELWNAVSKPGSRLVFRMN